MRVQCMQFLLYSYELYPFTLSLLICHVEMLAQLEEVCIVGYEPLSAVQASGGGGTNEVVGRLHTLLHTPDFEGMYAHRM